MGYKETLSWTGGIIGAILGFIQFGDLEAIVGIGILSALIGALIGAIIDKN